jgi:predicted membrane chloride channel (bestrophin family)
LFNESGVELIYQLLMENDLSALQKEIARTDRIIGTPTPLSYTRHIR